MGRDLNTKAAGLLFDMAALQNNERSRFGYRRAAKAIVVLPVGVDELVAAGALREVPFVGVSSARIITELVEQGRSPIVDAAVAAAGHPARVVASRAFRDTFLSQHVLGQVLDAPFDRSIVSRATYRGDFQMHSTWSDGAERVVSLARACRERGHTCMGITDHSYGLAIARGMSMDDARRQHAEIEGWNAKHGDEFRIYKGIEANILADGALDLTLEERRVFEFVVAAPHSLLRRPDDQTTRMVEAVKQPGVAILGHPRGRMFGTRPGVSADWDAVFEEAARREVAIEIDGNWHRQDIDYRLARRALKAGCLFALDSDAHSIPELRFSDAAIAHARLALIPSERVINCWDAPRLEAWMRAPRDTRARVGRARSVPR